MILCLSEPGEATITSVRPLSPSGGFHVDDFAVRPDPLLDGNPLLGTARGDLESVGFGSDVTVDIECGSRQVGQELGVQASRDTGADASSASWLVAYETDDSSGTLTIAMAVQLCTGSPSSSACSALAPFS
jgi:hypothetical protein